MRNSKNQLIFVEPIISIRLKNCYFKESIVNEFTKMSLQNH